MSFQRPDRRGLLIGAAALAAAGALPAFARTAPSIHVLKDPNCGCCSAWIDIFRAEGITVTTEASFGAQPMRYKRDNGVPPDMVSCHTGRMEGYVIEGHVPVADIRRLLDERPSAVGLAVPGMPYGSPGMGPEDRREAYDVHLIKVSGNTEVFSSYEAA